MFTADGTCLPAAIVSAVASTLVSARPVSDVSSQYRGDWVVFRCNLEASAGLGLEHVALRVVQRSNDTESERPRHVVTTVDAVGWYRASRSSSKCEQGPEGESSSSPSASSSALSVPSASSSSPAVRWVLLDAVLRLVKRCMGAADETIKSLVVCSRCTAEAVDDAVNVSQCSLDAASVLKRLGTGVRVRVCDKGPSHHVAPGDIVLMSEVLNDWRVVESWELPTIAETEIAPTSCSTLDVAVEHHGVTRTVQVCVMGDECLCCCCCCYRRCCFFDCRMLTGASCLQVRQVESGADLSSLQSSIDSVHGIAMELVLTDMCTSFGVAQTCQARPATAVVRNAVTPCTALTTHNDSNCVPLSCALTSVTAVREV